MAKHKLLYKKPAVKSIEKLPPHIKKRIKAKLEWFIAQKDPLRFSEHLTKPADAQYLECNNIVVLYVQHRSEVYKR
jgi:mRNA-degrading endonuclease RelE of RelBE toxin-antitoxin system